MKFVNTEVKAELLRTIESGQAEQKNNNKKLIVYRIIYQLFEAKP